MSAPMENFAGELKVEKCEDIPEELDLTSPNLDPLKVLYSENVYLPCENPTKFNNLAEYENVVIRGNELRNRGSRGGRGRGRIKTEIASSSRVASLKTKPKNDDSDTSEIDEAKAKLEARRKKMNRNVLNRMSNFEEGPMTILRRAVEEQLRVKVWTRSAVTRRGYCIAFVIAFDKHFNLALMDVDETYRIPKIIRKPITDSARKTSREKDDTTPPGDKQSSPTEDSDRLTDSKSCDGKSITKPISKSSDVKNKKSADRLKQNVSEGEDTDSDVTLLTQKLSIKHTAGSEDAINSKSTKSCQESSSQSTDKHSSKISDIAITQTDGNRGALKKFRIPKISKKETVIEKEVEEPEFVTEVEYKMKHRHVNQLFVRGDNVVSIVLLD